METLRQSLHKTADLIADYRESLPGLRVTPVKSRKQVQQTIEAEVSDQGLPADAVIDQLVAAAEPGLIGAPPIRVVGGAKRHATIDRALRLLGLGESSLVEVPARADGAMDTEALQARLAALPEGPTIVCSQAGNVNTGAFDDLATVATAARKIGAWHHVDGAFGLWAGASTQTAHLVGGIELADSWGCDGHKWLNVPYDSGYAFCAHPDVHATAMAYTASYLTGQVAGRMFGGGDFVLESSRRARGFASWLPSAPLDGPASPTWLIATAGLLADWPQDSTRSTVSKWSTKSFSTRSWFESGTPSSPTR
jgi:glutamate/tyrosine decarboxylase-like PLP-dependent enzyme